MLAALLLLVETSSYSSVFARACLPATNAALRIRIDEIRVKLPRIIRESN